MSAMKRFQFRKADVPPMPPRDVLPAGKYPAQVIATSDDPTKAGDGRMLGATWKITGPEIGGKSAGSNPIGMLVFDHFLVEHPSERAVAIQRNRLLECAEATDAGDFDDVSVLEGRSCLIEVIVQPPKDGYDAKNEVKHYHPLAAQPPSAAEAPAASSPTPPLATKAPWKRAA